MPMRFASILAPVIATLALVAALAGCAGPREPALPATPNILFFFSDDHRADAVGAYGNPVVQTPVLDGLAARGFNFRRAYVMGSHHGAVCAPSRAMLMTGRSLFNVYDNLDTLSTYPEHLRARGYVTFGTGKWHQSQASFARSFNEGRAVFFGGMADHFKVPLRDMRPDSTFTDPDSLSYSTTRFADAAVAFLERQAGSEAPFLAYVSFTVPHDPRTPPDDYLAMYDPADMPLPENVMPAHPFHNGWMTGRDEQLAAWPRDPEVIRAQIGEYYGLISHMDAEIGRVLEALERTGRADDTIVVFAGDNGLALGSHGLLGKQSLYEHSTHVPLIIAGPGIPAGETDALVYLYDIYPTLATQIQGMTAPERVEGQDLSAIWRGETAGVRASLFTTYEDLHRAVRDDRWKLIRYPKLHHTQLFDLETDPHELNNLADDPAYAAERDRLMALLETWQREAGDPHPLTAAERVPMDYDYRTFTRAPDRWQPQEIVDRYFR